MSVVFGGCSIPNLILNNKTESYKYSLTARQKKILKQEGLPLDYEKLNDTQKSAIECIAPQPTRSGSFVRPSTNTSI